MRIGLNLLYLLPGEVGGTETYARGLLHGLEAVGAEEQFVVFVSREARDWPLPKRLGMVRVVCPVSARRRANRYWFEQVRFPQLVRHHRIDVLHSLGYVAPLRRVCPSVVTVPDLNYRAFGDQMPRMRRAALEFFVKHSVHLADRVIALSEFSAVEILQAFDVQREHVVVIHLAAEPVRAVLGAAATAEDLLARDVRPPYIVAFSSRSPNKNIPRLIEAFVKARRSRGLAHQLVLVGHPFEDEDSGALGYHDSAIRFTGFLTEDALKTVLAHAEMLVFPSVYEGFGLPVLEAMAAGVPVVCSNRGSLPEVAGDAAVFFDPFSTLNMAEKLAAVAGDPALRAALVRRGRENLKRFSWEKAARETLRVYRDVVAARAP